MVNIEWLGTLEYREGLRVQGEAIDARRDGRIPDTIFLLEHPPVVTLGRRGDDSHILADSQTLAGAGVAVERVTRGGEVTYHGYGQLVGYLIFDIRKHIKRIAALMHGIEDVLIKFLKGEFGIAAHKDEQHPGVWAGGGKIAAIGMAIQRGISFHGFALNITTDLSHFDYIVACGLERAAHTSVAAERKRLRGAAAAADSGADDTLAMQVVQGALHPYLEVFYNKFADSLAYAESQAR